MLTYRLTDTDKMMYFCTIYCKMFYIYTCVCVHQSATSSACYIFTADHHCGAFYNQTICDS